MEVDNLVNICEEASGWFIWTTQS